METDHIKPKSEGGTDDIDNAIPVCFECHAEIHSYNIQHPRGRKFRSEELHEHKKQWIKLCKNRPDAFLSVGWKSDVGPLQSLIDELEFNNKVAHKTDPKEIGCLFLVNQFKRAINEGLISIIVESLRDSILEAYAAIGISNNFISAAIKQPLGNSKNTAINDAQTKIIDAKPKIEKAKDELLKFLGTESLTS
jgi:hypothetical protein